MRGILKTRCAPSAGLKMFVEEHASICAPSDLVDRSWNNRTDMVFIADFSVNRTGNELVLCFGIMAALLSGISS